MALVAFSVEHRPEVMKVLDRIDLVFASDAVGIATMNVGMKRVKVDDGRLYLIARYNPIWMKVYMLAPYLAFAAIAISLFFGNHWFWIAPIFFLSTYWFYSGSYVLFMIRLLFRKKGVNAKIEREEIASVFQMYVEEWGRTKS